MKSITKIYTIIIAGLLCFSCTDDSDLLRYRNVSKLSLKATMNAPSSDRDTRVEVTEDDTHGLLSKWVKNDKLNIYHEFVEKDDNDENAINESVPANVEFITEVDPTQGSDGKFISDFKYNSGPEKNLFFNPDKTVYALHNPTGSENSGDNYSSINIDLSGNDGTIESLGKADYLFGSINGKDISKSPIAFNHLISVLAVDIVINNNEATNSDKNGNKELFDAINNNPNLLPIRVDMYPTISNKPNNNNNKTYKFLSRSAKFNLLSSGKGSVNFSSIKESKLLSLSNSNGLCSEYKIDGNSKVFTIYIALLPTEIPQGKEDKYSIDITFSDKNNPSNNKSFMVSSSITFSISQLQPGRVYYGRRNCGVSIR